MLASSTIAALRRLSIAPAMVLAVSAVAGCAANGAGATDPPGAGTIPAPAPPDTRVYVYPGSGQSSTQVDRDRYECHMWAVRQTGYDPSIPQLAPHQRVQVVAMPPPGTNVLAGAATGAIIGAAVSNPYEQGQGAAVGAVAGAVLGAATDAARQQQANSIQHQYDKQDLQLQARLEQQANGYRRAITACLEGRGYQVK